MYVTVFDSAKLVNNISASTAGRVDAGQRLVHTSICICICICKCICIHKSNDFCLQEGAYWWAQQAGVLVRGWRTEAWNKGTACLMYYYVDICICICISNWICICIRKSEQSRHGGASQRLVHTSMKQKCSLPDARPSIHPRLPPNQEEKAEWGGKLLSAFFSLRNFWQRLFSFPPINLLQFCRCWRWGRVLIDWSKVQTKRRGLCQFGKHSADALLDLWLPQGVEILALPEKTGNFGNLRRAKVGQTLAWGPWTWVQGAGGNGNGFICNKSVRWGRWPPLNGIYSGRWERRHRRQGSSARSLPATRGNLHFWDCYIFWVLRKI